MGRKARKFVAWWSPTEGWGMLWVVITGVLIAALLTGLVTAGHYGLAYVEASHREGLATLIGAAATIFAGGLAWESLSFQARRAERKKEDRAILRKEDILVAVAPSIQASSILGARLVTELKGSGDAEGRSLRVKRAARTVREVFNPEVLLRLMDELRAEDRQLLLIIVGYIQAVLARAELGSDVALSRHDLEAIAVILANLHRYIEFFDPELAKSYAEDSKLPIEELNKVAGGNPVAIRWQFSQIVIRSARNAGLAQR